MSNQSVNVRNAFVARPGYYFIDVDYSQIEFRLSAALAGERPLLMGFMSGNDYYRMIYKQMTGGVMKLEDITKTQRQLGKVLSLGQNYGQEEYGLAFALGCSVELARQYMAQYWSGLPATAQAKDIALQRAIKEGGVRTWFGRWRPLPDLFSNVPKVRKKGIRSVWNTIIQGTAADWLKIAMVRCARALEGRDVHILLTVHDELLFEVNEKENLHEITEIIKQAMQFKVPGLPINNTDLYPDGYFVPVDIEYGYNWGDLYHLNADMKGGKVEKIGFKEYCAKIGKQINWDAPPPVIQVNFLATPSDAPRIVIPDRVRNVADAKPEHTSVVPEGMHPLDYLIQFMKKQLDPSAAEVKASVDSVLAEAASEPDLGPDVPSREVMREAVQPPIEVVTATGPVAEHQNGTNGKSHADPIPNPVSEPLPTNDFAYPCLIIKVPDPIQTKQLQFLQVLLAKYKGTHLVYIENQDKTICAGEKYRIDPSQEFQTYVKKCFGDKVQTEVYDQAGKPSRGRIAFV